ncbi:MAG TPA: GMC family oxidoreductase [Rhizomicrobium sp.]|nr:GMC family oxidoreductase [Rhizomicrobium sp.]
MRAFADARAVAPGSTIDTDLAIIGGGPAGITLALALANTPIRILLLESGGLNFETATQALYAGSETGVPYLTLQGSRLRCLGGSTGHWGGWCRPLDEIDFETRDWLPHSGWPITRKTLEPYYARAQSLVEAGPFIYDDAKVWTDSQGAPLPLGDGGVYTTYFQFSRQSEDVLPTNFGTRYASDLKRIPNLDLLLHANVTGLRLGGGHVDHLDVATLTGNKFKVNARHVVAAAGGIETARLLLASNDVMPAGIGNGHDLVGRFFADHPIPGQVATLVVFDGNLPVYYQVPREVDATLFRAAISPTDAFKRAHDILGSLTTIEGELQLDAIDRAAVAATASALGVDAGAFKAFTVGCGMELAPDPDRRLTLSEQRDPLGMPRLKLDMRVSDGDFARYRATLTEFGRQLLAARIGMLKLHHKTRAEWLSVMDWGNHHMGTTRMSADPRSGVVDANQQVFGVANLHVAGTSVFPTYGASNPTMNMLALTLRLADRLKGLLR